MYEEQLAQRLSQDNIQMLETCYQTTNEILPPTHVTVSRRIDAMYATAGVSSINATILQKYGGVGDHRVFIIDFTCELVLGSVLLRIIPPMARKYIATARGSGTTTQSF